jgi:hypothetical protein
VIGVVTSVATEYVKLEKRLVLLAWINSQFGYKDNTSLLRDMRDVEEGFDATGRSYVYHRLESRGDEVKIQLPVLAQYDDNIRAHLDSINKKRAVPIRLRYFQFLSVLFTEIYLDAYFNHKKRLLGELNRFVEKYNGEKMPGEVNDQSFKEKDLTKLAYWMATGSGKTLIMHINYLQFLHYNRDPLDNILLITPNEGLSDQHIEEMSASSIPCKRFELEQSGLQLGDEDAVRVIEIHKLVEEKKGGGRSVDVEAFEGNNLIFVDEGHKGTGGQAWRGFRDRLGETGFTFEYSATFGQALTASRKDELTAEYGKAIIFDYSYKYFYGDGHGKDFRILNLKEETTPDKTDLLLLGNLLSFYEQLRCYGEEQENISEYNLEKPLWVFVGSSVNAVYTEDKKKRSDVLTVARFLHRFLENRRGWVPKAIDRILKNNSGLVDTHGEDIFAGKFKHLRGKKLKSESIHIGVLSDVFHASGNGPLHMVDIRGAEGEIGLRAGAGED